MASLASVRQMDHDTSHPGTPPQQGVRDEQEDYYEIENCSVADEPPTSHTTHSHTHNHHNQRDRIGEIRSLPPHDSSPTHIPVTPHTESAMDNDYENQDAIMRQLMEGSSDEEEECEPRVIKSLVTEEQDYMNSSEMDRELEINGTGMGNLTTHYQETGELESQRHGNAGDWNGTRASGLEEPDYANSEAIDAELFKDNLKLKDSPTSTYDGKSGVSEHPLIETGNSPKGAVSCDPLPVGVVQKRYAPVRCNSTLHRESEIKLELVEQAEGFDPTILNTTSETDFNAPLDGLGDSEANLLLTERVKSSVSPYSIRPSYRGKPKKVDDPDLSRLGTLERTLLQTNGPTTQPMPNVLQIPWYHEGISRHIAESLLMSKTIRDGTYLLRDSVHSNESLTLSVRCQHSVKHYRILWDGRQFGFGLGKFPDLESLKEHFENQPVISGESGILVQLAYPYPRSVAEPAIYVDPGPVNEAASDAVVNNGVSNEKPVPKKWVKKDKKSVHTQSVPELSVNSKEGYLTKQGFRVKNWKRRWFILFRNEFKYYLNQESREPIRVIDLNEATAVERDDTQGKPHCFRLVTPNRTFFMYGSSETESNEWVQILDWRLGQRSRSNSRV